MALILASQSPRRRELLKLITEDFLVRPSDFDEDLVEEKDPAELVKLLAREKARSVEYTPEDVVIGCDTVVALDGRVFGKPADREVAREMLRQLSGKTHIVLSGVCVIAKGREISFVTETKVTFYPLTEEEIEAYLDTGEPFDKAGAYGIQGKGGLLVREIWGDYNNVVGLPVASLAKILRKMDIGLEF